MAGCYFRILNMPLELMSKLDYIFLIFLAFTSDVKHILQDYLKRSLVPQLQRLEREGIELTYRGITKKYKVLLFGLVC